MALLYFFPLPQKHGVVAADFRFVASRSLNRVVAAGARGSVVRPFRPRRGLPAAVVDDELPPLSVIGAVHLTAGRRRFFAANHRLDAPEPLTISS